MLQLGFGEYAILAIVIDAACWILLSNAIALAFTVAAISYFWLYTRTKYGHWKRCKIPGPVSVPPFGNLHTQMMKGVHIMDMENYTKYGKIWGTYSLSSPELNITDVNLLRSALVKDFHVFTNRRYVFPGLRQFFSPQQMGNLSGNKTVKDEKLTANDPTLFDEVIAVLHDEQWKKVRGVMTPAFNASKLKQMLPHIKTGVDTLSDIMAEESNSGDPIDLWKLFGKFTLDVIVRACMGAEIDSQRNPDNKLVASLHSMIHDKPGKLSLVAAMVFPASLNKVLEWIGSSMKHFDTEIFVRRTLAKLVDTRMDKSKNPPDFLQLLLNASVGKKESTFQSDEYMVNNQPNYRVRIKGNKEITDSEMLSQLYTLMGASFDSTPPTLALTTYYFALNPHIQQKAYEEAVAALDSEEELSYEAIQQGLPYIESCLMETLRISPPFTKFGRICGEDYMLNGIPLPKGSGVVANAYVIHHMPEHYPNPEKWIPERFSPEERAKRDPLTFLAFGYGPRNCIGMRFALLEMKMVMAYLVKRFNFVPSKQTREPEMSDRFGLLKPISPIYVEAIERRREL